MYIYNICKMFIRCYIYIYIYIKHSVGKEFQSLVAREKKLLTRTSYNI